MKHKSLKFYSVLALVLVLVAALPGVVQAEGEDDQYSGYVYAVGYIDVDGIRSYCSLNFSYRTYGTPNLYLYQSGFGPAGCPNVYKYLSGDAVPKDLISLGGPVDGWFAEGFDLTFEELAWSFDVTTYQTEIGEGKTTFYPSGNVSGYESKANRFHINSFDAQGTSYIAYDDEYIQGMVQKVEQ